MHLFAVLHQKMILVVLSLLLCVIDLCVLFWVSIVLFAVWVFCVYVSRCPFDVDLCVMCQSVCV